MKRFIFIFAIILFMTVPGRADNSVKDPNVAGQFYPADPQKLSSQIQAFLKAAPESDSQRHIEIVIAPHAGYVYSGQIAAYGFKQAAGQKYRTVVILAPSHHYGFPGISVWDKGGFKTPLGILNVDESFASALIEKDPLFANDPKAFDQEHALEVELPFIQEAFGDVKIVPVIMGQANFQTCQKLADSLDALIGDRDDVLIVVSSDMSHFHNDATARAMDGETIKTIESFDAKRLWQLCAMRKLEMCGFVPVSSAILLAQKRGWGVDILTYGNSGDTTGDKGNVVGYTSVIFYSQADDDVKEEIAAEEGVASLTFDQKKRLIDMAKQTIDLYVREKKTLDVNENDPRLNEIEGAFVTIHKHGQLRGCIGNIIGRQPLYLTVRDMAIAAASSDPRFMPVKPNELKDLEIEISVLSQPYRAKDPQEIQMGVHGVIVKRGWNQGVFLPQVATETGWDRDTFLSQLCAQKAGLPADAWKDPGTELNIFTATVFSEKDIEENK